MTSSDPTRRAVLSALALAPILASPILASPFLASPALAAAMSAEDQALQSKVVAYLEALTSAKGRFMQTDPRGDKSEGSIYLQRPGKARFEYDPPSGLLITSDGKIVTVSNSRLRTNTQRYSFGATPLSLFLGRQIRLDRGVAVTSVVRQPGGFTIVVRDARGQAEGSVALEFADNPMRLRGWTLTDAQRHATTVKITELEPVGALPDSLFQQPTSPTR